MYLQVSMQLLWTQKSNDKGLNAVHASAVVYTLSHGPCIHFCMQPYCPNDLFPAFRYKVNNNTALSGHACLADLSCVLEFRCTPNLSHSGLRLTLN